MTGDAAEIRTETFYRHPPERVWRALTDPAALAAWLMPNDFAPALGHRFTFRTSPVPPYFDGVVRCEVIELDPPRALAYTWRGPVGMDTVMRWELTAARRDGVPGTLVVGVHSGFDLGDPGQAAGFRAMSGGWGGRLAAALGRVLDDLATSRERQSDMRVAVVSIPVSDQDRAKKFYTEIMGFTVVADEVFGEATRWVMLSPPGGGAAITLVTWFPTMPAGSTKGLVYEVADIEATRAALTGRGVEFPDGVREEPWGSYLTLDDPDGNGIILQQPPTG